jgi:hypothetical protein
MKKLSLFIAAVFLIGSQSFSQQANAQKSESEKDKEYRIQMEIEQQKKAMSEQKKAEEQMLKELKESQKEMEKQMKEISVSVEVPDVPDIPDIPDVNGFDRDDNMVRVFSRSGDRSFRFEEPFAFTPDQNNYHVYGYDDNGNRTRWEFSKNVKESSFSREYSFDVEKTAKSVVMSVMGDCKAGEIRIKITMPNGKTYSEILIDESGNLNWRKSFTITETENQDKAGEWKYEIGSKNATGFFKISLQTN